MDGFVLILAIIVFSVFKNVMQEAKKKQERSSLPDVSDTISEHDEAQARAREALRRWEAKQRALNESGPERPLGTSRPGPVRIPRPGEHRSDVRLSSPGRLQQEMSRQQSSWRQSAQRGGRGLRDARLPRPALPAEPGVAERTRKEAYDAIRQLLAGQARPSGPPEAMSLPARQAERNPAERLPAERPDAIPARRPRIRGTLARRREEEALRIEALPPTGDRDEDGGMGSARGLERLDRLPRVARGILYAELLGTPVGLREPRRVIGD